MKRLTSLLSLAFVFSLSVAYAAHDHGYSVGKNNDPSWISSELMGRGIAVKPIGSLVGTTQDGQVGWFSNLVSDVTSQFTNGVILSTGNIEQGANTIINDKLSFTWGVDGKDECMNNAGSEDWDCDLARISGVGKTELMDVAGFVLYVVPSNKTINIPFMMASEEYFHPYAGGGENYYVPDDPEIYKAYSDKFAFFVKKIDTIEASSNKYTDMGFVEGDNIATLPDGSMVEIATVNQHTNQDYFVANVVTNGSAQIGNEFGLVFPTGDMPIPMEFNGAIIGPVAVCTNVEPQALYVIKVVIADSGERTINSAIFLKDHGFTSGADLKISVTGPEPLPEPGPVTFTNVVSNVGDIPASCVVVTNYLPLGISTDEVAVKTDVGEVGGWQTAGETNFCVWAIGDNFAVGSNAVMRVICNTALAIGSYTNIATVGAFEGDYNMEDNTADFVAKVAGDGTELPTLTVTAISTNWTYGAMPPDLTPLKFIKSIDTNENQNVTVTGITVEFTNSVGTVVDSIVTAGVGTYGICLKGIVGTGIEGAFKEPIVYNPGVLTIDKTPLTITAGNTNKVYGTTLALGNTNFKAVGLADWDTIETVELTSVGTNENAVVREGGYDINPGNVLKGNFNPDNYEITPVPGVLDVKPLEIWIVASDEIPDRNYGESYTLVGDECTITDAQGKEYFVPEDSDAPNRFALLGDDYIDVDLACAGLSKQTVAGDYAITVDYKPNAALGNYDIHKTPSKLTVTLRKITITALDTNKVYGTELELDGTAFKITQGNLAEGDEIYSVELTSDGTNKVVAVNEVDGYPIKPVSVKESNIAELDKKYDVTFAEDGKFRVKKRDLTLKLNDVTREYGDVLDIEGTNFTVDASTLLPDFEIPTNVASIVCTTNTSEVGDFPGTVVTSSVPVVSGSHTMAPGYNFNPNNYNIKFENGNLKVTPAELTINVNNNIWRVGKPKPEKDNTYVSFREQLKGGDEERDVIGGNVSYTNRTRKTGYMPTIEEASTNAVYKDEIWIRLAGAKAKNYAITVMPGDMMIKLAAVDLVIELEGAINGWTGCDDVKFTVKNIGDKIPADYNYWVELKPQTNDLGQVEYCICRRLTFDSTIKRFKRDPADPMPNGYEYIDLTDTVTNLLVGTGNGDTVFDKDEQVTITGFSFYYCTDTGARRLLKDVIGTAPKNFFVAGKLFHPADKDHDFKVEENPDEKFSPEMEELLGSESVFDYIEMTRLSLLEYYHWDTEKATWDGPKKKGAK